jgi:hypothetical protein
MRKRKARSAAMRSGRAVVRAARRGGLAALSRFSKALGGPGCSHRRLRTVKSKAKGADGKLMGWSYRACADCGRRVQGE